MRQRNNWGDDPHDNEDYWARRRADEKQAAERATKINALPDVIALRAYEATHQIRVGHTIQIGQPPEHAQYQIGYGFDRVGIYRYASGWDSGSWTIVGDDDPVVAILRTWQSLGAAARTAQEAI